MANALFSGIPNEFPILRTDMWSLLFPPEMNISERFQVTAQRPSWSNSVKELKYKNSFTKYKGPTRFNNINISFRDVVGPSVMQKLYNWQREHYDPVTGCGGYPSIYKKNITLVMEDECGNPVQQWIFYGCFIASLNGGNLNMEDDANPATVELEIAYDYVSLEF